MSLCCFGARKKTGHVQRGTEGTRNGQVQRGTEGIPADNVRLFSYNELRSATGNFNQTNKIGGGGFGVVYKGILRDETQVAVKSLSAESSQGVREFLTEIDMISNIRHPNLVQLIGCCIEGNSRMLVYEYLENNSLANALLGPKSKRIPLDWRRRAAICMGAAHGLAFLHEEAEPHIVHRDIKASNVLLDKDLVPKIGDFGLAKLFPDNVTHISTRVAGTMGYLAPEYALLGQLTKKADIYSFGVLILEIISGRGSTKAAWGEGMELLLEWTWKLRQEDKLLEIVDPELVEYPEEEVLRFIKVALFCAQEASQQRPSMTQVVEMLTHGINLDEEMLTQPGLIKTKNRNSIYSGSTSQTSQPHKGKRSTNTSTFITSTNLSISPITITQMQPR
ncbi:putative serine/threonine-protein kinase isoform X2 [Tasmannia lanceolata]|uniref:putative serine/threonine-protein kinase isoform X2 n=1 Tax=Tasmannia lanceolata TaxID=3420 RepID=UPI0040648B71